MRILLSCLLIICLSLVLGACAHTYDRARPLDTPQARQALAQLKALLAQAADAKHVRVDTLGLENTSLASTSPRSRNRSSPRQANRVAWSQVSGVSVVADTLLLPRGLRSWQVLVEGRRLLAPVSLGYFKTQEQAQQAAEVVRRLSRLAGGGGGR